MSAFEQYSLYASLITGLGMYSRLSYKHYWLERFVKESDSLEKSIIKGKFPFNSGELEAAESYLKKYGKSQRKWILFPVAYIAFEAIKLFNSRRR